jgi:putative hemolysin
MLAALLDAQRVEDAIRRAVIDGDSRITLPTVPLAELHELYMRVRAYDSPSVAQGLLDALRVTVQETGSLATIPASGPAVIVANHPFGLLDGAVLLSVLMRVRPDVRLLVNRVLRCVPGVEEHCIFVDPFSTADRGANAAALRRALRWLRGGGLLATFPAGEVAHIRLEEAALTDPQWTPTAAWLAQHARCDLVPIFFQGQNSVPFQILGLIHPALRTLRLPEELLNKTHKTVRFGIGRPISGKQLAEIGDTRAVTSVARWRTFSVSNRIRPRPHERFRYKVMVATGIDRAHLEDQLRALRAEGGLLEETADYELLLMPGARYSAVLHEIGRARERAFRRVGEGSGNALDLDIFDQYYDQLVLWHKRENTIAGGYRLARTSDVLARRGIRGLYTSTLFRFKRAFFDELGPAVELGRSFVAPEFQKQYAPLYLLWRGIGRYLAAGHRASVLFGPVSISREYSDKSRQLITTYFKLRNGKDPLAPLVVPKSFRRPGKLRPWELQVLAHFPDVDSLSSEVAQLEPDGKGLPVLIRQYVRLGGRLLAFNQDAQFGDVIDGLVVVDVKKADPAAVAKYIGESRYKAICTESATATSRVVFANKC